MATFTMRPTAAGDVTQLTPSAGSNYTCVDEAVANDDTDYVSGVSPGGAPATFYDLYAATNHSAEYGTITNVTVYIRCKATGGAGATAATKVKVGGTEYAGSDNALTDGVWSNFSTSYNVSPKTTAAWTWAEIDGMQIGVTVTSPNLVVGCYCTQVYAVVTFSAQKLQQSCVVI